MRGGNLKTSVAKQQLAMETGRLIKRLRAEKHCSQEDLASGICAISTLSRIENGSAMPSRELFIRLMNRLGVSDEAYGGMYSPQEIVIKDLQHQLLTALEYDRLQETSQWLWTLQQLTRQDDVAGRQFLALIEILMRNEEHEKALSCRQSDLKSEIDWQNEAIRACANALRLTVPDFRTDQSVSHLPLTQVEMILINNIGLACVYSERYRTAVRLLSELERCLSRRAKSDAAFTGPQAIVRNNLAVCIAKMDLCTEAMLQINQAIQMNRNCGSMIVLAKLLHTRMVISRCMNDMDTYYEDYHVLLSLAGILPSQEGRRTKVEKLLGQRPGIRIL